MREIIMLRPDDMHLHLRDGDRCAAVAGHSARGFARAVVMPNLQPPVTTAAAALEYRRRIVADLPGDTAFEPLMTLYLTDNTTPAELALAARHPEIVAAKLYPAGATTNSDHGVTDLGRIDGALEALEHSGMPLLVHGEVTDPAVDIFEREKVFIDRVLAPLVGRYQGLKVVVEHLTTRDGVDFVLGAREGVAATITAHHLLMNRNAIFAGGIRPHHYCLPVLKAEVHRRALVEAATSGNPRFFLGTDSAPHPRAGKEAPCGCAGIFTAHAAVELYAEAFDQAGALDRLEAFCSIHGAGFYGLPRNRDSITLVDEPWTVPETYPFGDDVLIPLRAGERVGWRIRGEGASC